MNKLRAWYASLQPREQRVVWNIGRRNGCAENERFSPCRYLPVATANR